ncbi:MAG: hypothetical protein PVH99_15715, partial [Desulfobacteraceae bacterium]
RSAEAQTAKYGVTAGPGGTSFEIRPFKKARSLVQLAPKKLKQSRVPSLRPDSLLWIPVKVILEACGALST